MALGFSWDSRKAAGTERKHGVSFEGCYRLRRSSVTSSVATTRESSTLGSPPVENGPSMKKATKGTRTKKVSRRNGDDEMRPEYDFSGGVRGKYAKRYAEGTNLILLEPDLAAEFPDAQSVSPALRAFLKSRSKRRTA